MNVPWFVSLFVLLLLGSSACVAGWQEDLDAAKAATASGKVDEAIGLYRRALGTGEVPVEPFMDAKKDTVFSVGFSLAYLLDAKGDVEGAIAQLNDLKETYIPIVTKDDDVMGEYERDTILILFFPRISELYAKNEQYDQAIAVLEEGLALSSLDPLHADLAWLLAAAPDKSLRNAEKALEHAQIAVDTNRNADGLAALAAAHAESGNLQEAVTHQEEAIAAEKTAERPSAERILALDKQLAIYKERLGPSAPVAEAEPAVAEAEAEAVAPAEAEAEETAEAEAEAMAPAEAEAEETAEAEAEAVTPAEAEAEETVKVAAEAVAPAEAEAKKTAEAEAEAVTQPPAPADVETEAVTQAPASAQAEASAEAEAEAVTQAPADAGAETGVETEAVPDGIEQSSTAEATVETEAQPVLNPKDLSSKQIRDLQKMLFVRGFKPGRIDGRWGKRTEDALKRMQEDQGLPATGQLDAATQEKLGL